MRFGSKGVIRVVKTADTQFAFSRFGVGPAAFGRPPARRG
jgi:hypothetical protein